MYMIYIHGLVYPSILKFACTYNIHIHVRMTNPPISYGSSLFPSQRISELMCDIESDAASIERGQSAMAVSQYTCEVIKTAVQVTKFNLLGGKLKLGESVAYTCTYRHVVM